MKKLFLFALILVGGLHTAAGQTLQITGNPPTFGITNASELANGKQQTHQTVNIVNPLLGILPVELYVRCTGNLTSGSNSIPSAAVRILVTAPTSTPDPERTLSTSNQRVLAYQPPLLGLFSTQVMLRYRLTGGPDFFKPAGTYSTTIIYTLTLD